MNNTHKGANWIIIALFIASTALPVLNAQYAGVKALATCTAIVGALWTGRNYLVSDDEEDKPDSQTLIPDSAPIGATLGNDHE